VGLLFFVDGMAERNHMFTMEATQLFQVELRLLPFQAHAMRTGSSCPLLASLRMVGELIEGWPAVKKQSERP